MVDQTLCHVFDGDRLLLKMANRGISKGKWNAPGGKIEDGETPEENIVREVQEETGLEIKDLTSHGSLRFHMDGKDDLSFVVYLFSTRSFSGELKSSDAGEVKWFSLDEIPYDMTWDDDQYWWPLMFKNKKFNVDFYFDNENKKVLKYLVDLQ